MAGLTRLHAAAPASLLRAVVERCRTCAATAVAFPSCRSCLGTVVPLADCVAACHCSLLHYLMYRLASR
eukprot:8661026-Alexandrium_andersonii.AAC.2